MLQSLLGFVWPVLINATMDMMSLNCTQKGILFEFLCVVNWMYKFNQSRNNRSFHDLLILLFPIAGIFAVTVEIASLGTSRVS